MSVLNSISNELRRIFLHYKYAAKMKTGPVTFHTEMIFDDRVWEKIKAFVKSGKKSIWFILTPVNYDFVKIEHGLRLPKKRYEKIILDRYKWLKNQGQEIQLHLHLSRVLTEMYVSKKQNLSEQEKYFKESVGWLRKNGFKVTKVTFGWWNYDENSLKLARKYRLKVVNQYDYYWVHDFDFLRAKNRQSVLKI